MNSNRFDFLEFGDEAARAERTVGETTTQAPRGEAHPHLGGSGFDTEGRPLAQVIVTDQRGYYALLSEAIKDPNEPHIGMSLEPQRPGAFRLAETIGSRGSGAGELNYPGGLAVDSAGVLFVADAYNHRVQRFTPDGGVACIGCRGTAHGQFLSPQAVAVDDQGAFYILEQGNNRVQKFSSTGVQQLVFGRAGHLPGELYGPTAITVARSGLIYIADTGNSRVQIFSGDGEFLGFAGSLAGSRRLMSPQSIAIDERDNIYIADTLTHRILRFDSLGKMTGELGSVLQTSGGNIPRLVEPRAVAIDPAGLIYVADRGDMLPDGNPSLGRLQAIESQGNWVKSHVDRLPGGLGLLYRPGGIAIGPPSRVPRNAAPRGDVYVSDTMNHRILRFVWDWI